MINPSDPLNHQTTESLVAAILALRDSRRSALNLMEDAIVARRQAEQVTQALRASEMDFRAYFEHVGVGTAQIDAAGHFKRVNERFCLITGYPQEELLAGMGPLDLDHPSDREVDRQRIERFMQGLDETYETEKRYRRKDGVTVWVHVTARFIRDEQGHHRFTAAVIEDITARKLAEESLRAKEAMLRKNEGLLRAITDHSEDMIFVKDRESRLLFLNPAGYRQHRLTPEQSLGKTDAEIHPDMTEAAFFVEADQRVMESGKTILFEEPFTTHTGEHRILLTAKTPRRDEDGNIIGIIGISRDITERKQAEDEIRRLNTNLEQRVRERTAQLERANKELEAFSYSVSHDLRAPLRAVLGFVSILQQNYRERLDEEGHRLLGVVSSEATRMGRLIDDLLAFSRMGRQERQNTEIDMAALARMEFEIHTSTLPASAALPTLELHSLPHAKGDPSMLRQVFANLIGNAVKFTRHQTRPLIEVGGTSDGLVTTYYVRDNGVGFDEKYRHKLFGVFQRLHSETEFEGNGVGLALVQRHGGQVWAESKLGQGATFSFTLPSPVILPSESPDHPVPALTTIPDSLPAPLIVDC
jgi:PAS domain S-box-containing protein